MSAQGRGLRTPRVSLLPALVLVVAALGVAHADSCVDGARGEYEDCRAGCREDLQVTRDGCHNRDHACVEACRADREDCRDASGIEADIEACDLVRATEVANCRNLYPAGSDRDVCIDGAQIDAFQCRDQAREDNLTELIACRTDFRLCAKSCPLVDPGLLETDRGTCRLAARRAYRRCIVGCREDFQVVRDACANRDHDCVEGCRDQRHTCVAPILAQLEAAIAACRATRNAAVATCHSLHPADSPELDGCIDQAQVVAFRCRDDAREAARPGFADCRLDFRTCVTGCPPVAGSPSGAFVDLE